MLVFPEGERTKDGEMEPFRTGISLLIKKMNARIVPAGLAGAYDAWSRQARLPSFSPLFLGASQASIAISIGKPIDSSTISGLSRDEILARLFVAVKTEFEKAKRLKRQDRPSPFMASARQEGTVR